MKTLWVTVLCLALTGCGGGYDDIDAMRDANIGFGSTVTKPSNPNNPNVQNNWQYSSTAEGSRVFMLRATTYALNTYQDPNYQNLKGRPWLTLERNKSIDDKVSDSVVIFADSDVACSPTCDIRMSFDGTWATYRMRNSIDSALRPNDDATATTLYKKFASSNRATVRLPIIGLSSPFDANFDLSGYDLKQMNF